MELSIAMTPLVCYLLLSALLFSIGLAGALTRRNAIIILIGIELMLNAANLNFIAFWRFGPNPEALTGILSKELRGRSITVNAIAPGPTATDLFLHGKTQELIDHMAKMNPLERLGTPQDIAAAVSFLAGPDGAWINGQVLRANGGMI